MNLRIQFITLRRIGGSFTGGRAGGICPENVQYVYPVPLNPTPLLTPIIVLFSILWLVWVVFKNYFKTDYSEIYTACFLYTFFFAFFLWLSFYNCQLCKCFFLFYFILKPISFLLNKFEFSVIYTTKKNIQKLDVHNIQYFSIFKKLLGTVSLNLNFKKNIFSLLKNLSIWS